MAAETFKAFWVEEVAKNEYKRSIIERKVADLPEGDLLIKVHYSSLNYKDALSAVGNKGVTRNFPHTPGIDAAGEVVSCESGRFAAGDRVLVTGYDLGMNTHGGYGQYIRIPSEWAIPLPAGLTLKETMILGTAGFTAALSVWKMQQGGVAPGDGDILVTGATGGVGSIAVSILARAGYRVVAATGKMSEKAFLEGLGAAEVISRDEVMAGAERPMMKTRWAGAIDVAGGDTLAAVLKATNYGGVVTCCGLVGSPDLSVNVFPFILRGVSLIGIDSVECPMGPRLEVWKKLASDWKPEQLEQTASACTLEGLEEKIEQIMKGQIRGRTLVDMQA